MVAVERSTSATIACWEIASLPKSAASGGAHARYSVDVASERAIPFRQFQQGASHFFVHDLRIGTHEPNCTLGFEKFQTNIRNPHQRHASRPKCLNRSIRLAPPTLRQVFTIDQRRHGWTPFSYFYNWWI